MAAGDAGVQEGGHGVDGEGPEDGHDHEHLDPAGHGHVTTFMFEGGPADDGVEQQVAAKHRASQNMTEFGVGCRMMFSTRCGWPISTTMNSMHMTTAPMARNSPKMITRLNGL